MSMGDLNIGFFFFFFKISLNVDHFQNLLNLIQCCFCFKFWVVFFVFFLFFNQEHVGCLPNLSLARSNPHLLLEVKVITT